MSAERALLVCELVAAREDARLLLLDIRLPGERAEHPIENPFFQVVYAPRDELPQRTCSVARLLGNRHVVVVDDYEARAESAAALLRGVEVDALALEGGISGWQIVLVALQAECRH